MHCVEELVEEGCPSGEDPLGRMELVRGCKQALYLAFPDFLVS